MKGMLDKVLALTPRRWNHLPYLFCVLVITLLFSVILYQYAKSNGFGSNNDLSFKGVKYTFHDGMNDNVNTWESIFKSQKSLENINDPSRPEMLRNITVDKYSGRIFTVMSAAEDFTPMNFSSIIQSPETVNNFQSEFLIKGEHICGGPSPFLLIVIPSKVGNHRVRIAIRETWMDAVTNNKWPRESIDKTVRFLFLLGKNSENKSSSVRNLQFEDSLYHDIVLVNIEDSYRNLTRKIINGLRWVNTYCKDASYTLKLDEDTFVNVPLLLRLLTWIVRQSKHNTFVLGQAHGSYKPSVLRYTRWAVPRYAYPLDIFPRYLYGHSYVISNAAIPKLVEMAYHVKLIPTEDSYVTGVLTKLSNVVRIDAKSFTVCCTDIFDCEIVKGAFVTMTSVETPADYHRLWKSVVEKKCHPQIAFNHKKRHRDKVPVTRYMFKPTS